MKGENSGKKKACTPEPLEKRKKPCTSWRYGRPKVAVRKRAPLAIHPPPICPQQESVSSRWSPIQALTQTLFSSIQPTLSDTSSTFRSSIADAAPYIQENAFTAAVSYQPEARLGSSSSVHLTPLAQHSQDKQLDTALHSQQEPVAQHSSYHNPLPRILRLPESPLHGDKITTDHPRHQWDSTSQRESQGQRGPQGEEDVNSQLANQSPHSTFDVAKTHVMQRTYIDRDDHNTGTHGTLSLSSSLLTTRPKAAMSSEHLSTKQAARGVVQKSSLSQQSRTYEPKDVPRTYTKVMPSRESLMYDVFLYGKNEAPKRKLEKRTVKRVGKKESSRSHVLSPCFSVEKSLLPLPESFDTTQKSIVSFLSAHDVTHGTTTTTSQGSHSAIHRRRSVMPPSKSNSPPQFNQLERAQHKDITRNDKVQRAKASAPISSPIETLDLHDLLIPWLTASKSPVTTVRPAQKGKPRLTVSHHLRAETSDTMGAKPQLRQTSGNVPVSSGNNPMLFLSTSTKKVAEPPIPKKQKSIPSQWNSSTANPPSVWVLRENTLQSDMYSEYTNPSPSRLEGHCAESRHIKTIAHSQEGLEKKQLDEIALDQNFSKISSNEKRLQETQVKRATSKNSVRDGLVEKKLESKASDERKVSQNTLRPKESEQPFLEPLESKESSSEQPFPQPLPLKESSLELPFPQPLPLKESSSELPFPQPLPLKESSLELPFPQPLPLKESSSEQPFPQPLPLKESSSEQPFPQPLPLKESSLELPFPQPLPLKESSLELPFPQPLPLKESSLEQPFPQPLPLKESSLEQPFPQPLPLKESSLEQLFPQPLPLKESSSEQPFPQPLPLKESSSELPFPQPLPLKESSSELPFPQPLPLKESFSELPFPQPLPLKESSLEQLFPQPLPLKESSSELPFPQPLPLKESSLEQPFPQPLEEKENQSTATPVEKEMFDRLQPEKWVSKESQPKRLCSRKSKSKVLLKRNPYRKSKFNKIDVQLISYNNVSKKEPYSPHDIPSPSHDNEVYKTQLKDALRKRALVSFLPTTFSTAIPVPKNLLKKTPEESEFPFEDVESTATHKKNGESTWTPTFKNDNIQKEEKVMDGVQGTRSTTTTRGFIAKQEEKQRLSVASTSSKLNRPSSTLKSIKSIQKGIPIRKTRSAMKREVPTFLARNAPATVCSSKSWIPLDNNPYSTWSSTESFESIQLGTKSLRHKKNESTSFISSRARVKRPTMQHHRKDQMKTVCEGYAQMLGFPPKNDSRIGNNSGGEKNVCGKAALCSLRRRTVAPHVESQGWLEENPVRHLQSLTSCTPFSAPDISTKEETVTKKLPDSCVGEAAIPKDDPEPCIIQFLIPKREPAVYKAEPAVYKAEPAAHIEEPIARTGEPAAHKEEAALLKSEPIVSASESIVVKKESATSAPEGNTSSTVFLTTMTRVAKVPYLKNKETPLTIDISCKDDADSVRKNMNASSHKESSVEKSEQMKRQGLAALMPQRGSLKGASRAQVVEDEQTGANDQRKSEIQRMTKQKQRDLVSSNGLRVQVGSPAVCAREKTLLTLLYSNTASYGNARHTAGKEYSTSYMSEKSNVVNGITSVSGHEVSSAYDTMREKSMVGVRARHDNKDSLMGVILTERMAYGANATEHRFNAERTQYGLPLDHIEDRLDHDKAKVGRDLNHKVQRTREDTRVATPGVYQEVREKMLNEMRHHHAMVDQAHAMVMKLLGQKSLPEPQYAVCNWTQIALGVFHNKTRVWTAPKELLWLLKATSKYGPSSQWNAYMCCVGNRYCHRLSIDARQREQLDNLVLTVTQCERAKFLLRVNSVFCDI